MKTAVGQRSLFDNRRIDERFAEFLKTNPDVWDLFKRLAYRAQASGVHRYSAKAIIERIRWEYTVERKRSDGDRDDFKINDHFTSRFVRKLITEDPTFAGFFETRQIRTP